MKKLITLALLCATTCLSAFPVTQDYIFERESLESIKAKETRTNTRTYTDRIILKRTNMNGKVYVFGVFGEVEIYIDDSAFNFQNLTGSISCDVYCYTHQGIKCYTNSYFRSHATHYSSGKFVMVRFTWEDKDIDFLVQYDIEKNNELEIDGTFGY